MNFNFRAIWYAVLVWIFLFFASGVVLAPWFYVIVPLLVLLFTVYYFEGVALQAKNGDDFIKCGFGVAIFWFLFAIVFSLLEIVGFYYFDLAFYFSDFKNVYLFPTLLIVPAVYGIVLSNRRGKERVKKTKKFFRKSGVIFRF